MSFIVRETLSKSIIMPFPSKMMRKPMLKNKETSTMSSLNSAKLPIIFLTLGSQLLSNFSLQNKVSELGLCTEGNWCVHIVEGIPIRPQQNQSDLKTQMASTISRFLWALKLSLFFAGDMAWRPDVPHFSWQPDFIRSVQLSHRSTDSCQLMFKELRNSRT